MDPTYFSKPIDLNQVFHKNTPPPLHSEPQTKSATIDNTKNTQGLNIVKSALPYLNYPLQKNLAILIKVLELQNTFRLYEDSTTVPTNALINTENPKESMLYSIRECCSDNNKTLVDIILNMMKMNQLFKTYNQQSSGKSLPQTIQSSPIVGGASGGGATNQNTNIVDLLKSMLTKEQKEVFDMITSMSTSEKEVKPNE